MGKTILTLSEIPMPDSARLERQVLGELIDSPEHLTECERIINDDMFFNENCRNTFKMLKEMEQTRIPIDLVNVMQRVDRNFLINEILPYSTQGNSLSIMEHCEALRNVNQKRKLYISCLEGLRVATSPNVSDTELLQIPQRMSEEMQKGAREASTEKLCNVLDRWADNIQTKTNMRVTTGFPMLDRSFLGGFGGGQLEVIAARPSVGKTAFMLQMAKSSAMSGVPTLALSLEMTNEELAQRLMYSTETITPREIADGQVDWNKTNIGINQLYDLPLYMDETPSTLDEVCTMVTLAHLQGKCDIAYIDYLQLMTGDSSDSLYKQVTGMTKRLKRLAKLLKIPIVVLCQLNRANVSEGRTPQLHDLRDSGSIEQDADKVLMLQREIDEQGEPTPLVTMFIRKNREGRCGADYFISNRSYTQFKEVTQGEYSDNGGHIVG